LGGFCDALFNTVYLHEGVNNILENMGMNINNSVIMVSAIASASSIMVTDYIDRKIDKKKNVSIFKYPIIDIIGLIIGNYLFILFFR
jgi:hypothetical protein